MWQFDTARYSGGPHAIEESSIPSCVYESVFFAPSQVMSSHLSLHTMYASARGWEGVHMHADVPVQHIVMTLEVPDGDSRTAVQSAAQQVAALLTTFRPMIPPANWQSNFHHHPPSLTDSTAPTAATPAAHAPLHLPPFPVYHPKSPPHSNTTTTPTSHPPHGHTNTTTPHSILQQPSSRLPPYQDQCQTASVKPNSASLHYSSRLAEHFPVPPPTQAPFTTPQPAPAHPYHPSLLHTVTPGSPQPTCEAARQLSQAHIASQHLPQPHVTLSVATARSRSRPHASRSTQVQAAHYPHPHTVPGPTWTVRQGAHDPHHGAPATQQHARTQSSRSLDTAVDLIGTSLHQGSVPHVPQSISRPHQPLFSPAAVHQKVPSQTQGVSQPWNAAQRTSNPGAEVQAQQYPVHMVPCMWDHADIQCMTTAPNVSLRPAATLQHNYKARSWSPTKPHPRVHVECRVERSPRRRATSLEPHHRALPVPVGELYPDPFTAPPHCTSPLHLPHQLPIEAHLSLSHQQVLPPQPLNLHQGRIPAWIPADQGQCHTAQGGHQSMHMHTPGCEALNMSINKVQSSQPSGLVSEHAAHHRVLPPHELLAKLRVPLGVLQMPANVGGMHQRSSQCWRPPRPPHARRRSTGGAGVGRSRSTSPHTPQGEMQGAQSPLHVVIQTLSSTPSHALPTRPDRQVATPAQASQADSRNERSPGHSLHMQKHSSAPDPSARIRTKPPGAGSRLRSNLLNQMNENISHRCTSTDSAQKRRDRQVVPSRLATSQSPVSRRLAALRSSLDPKLRESKSQTLEDQQQLSRDTLTQHEAEELLALEHTMTSLQTTPASSALGSMKSRHLRGSRANSSQQHQSVSLRDMKAGVRKGGSSIKVDVPSRSSSCISAEGNCQGINDSPRSSSVSLPDNTQMESPNSEDLSGYKVGQKDKLPQSSGRHANSHVHSSTVETGHKSLLCEEVLSLKAVLET